MAGVYRVGGTWHRQAGRDIAGAITTIRKRRAEEEEAARKAAKAAEKARKAAEAKAIKEKAKAEKLRKANLKEFGPHTDQELSDLGYSSKGHYRTAADEWGQLSTGDQKGYTDKQMEAELKRDAKAGGKGGKSKKGPNYRTKAEIKAAQKRMSGVTDLDEELANIESAQNQKEALARALAKKKSVQETADAAAEADRQRELRTIRGFDSDAYAAQQRIDAEEAASVEEAREKEKKDAAWFDIQRKITEGETAKAEKIIGRETKGFGETGNIDWSNARRRELFELTKEDKAALKEADGEMPATGWPTPQAYSGLRGFPPKPMTRERIMAINEDFENHEKDAVTQSVMNIAEQQALYNGTTSREEFVKIQALIASGEVTVVQVVDNANGTMDASPVSEDGLRDQLRETDPTYIDAGPNPVVRIDGVLYEKFGDQFFPLEEMTTDEGMDIGGLPSLPTTPTRGQFVPQKFNLDPLTTTGSDSYARSIFRS